MPASFIIRNIGKKKRNEKRFKKIMSLWKSVGVGGGEK